MNQSKIYSFLATVVLSATAAWAEPQPIVLMSPPDYQVLAISPNGKWATGIFSDYSYAQRGFLWNLESDTFEQLSTSEESMGWAVANDGTVCGAFTDCSTSEIGAGTMMPGYYRNGEWHSVEVPQGFSGPEDNYHGAGQGYGISADGTVITGAVYVNGNYTPAVWREGQLVQLLDVTNEGMQGGAPYCISPDGTMVGGWTYRYNRACTLWNVADNTRKIIGTAEGPWSSVDRFSPDGKKVILGGGWDESIPEDAETQYYFSIYDIETGELTSLPAYDRNSTVRLFGISNSYTCVGSTADYDGGRAVIYPNGTGPAILMEDYLRERGVDIDNMGLLVPEEIGYMLLFRAQDISADDNIHALLAYDQYGMRSMIVMFNQDAEHAAPIEVKARQLSGIATTEISWSAPIRSTEGIQSYRIYRDDAQIAEVSADVRSFFDPALAYGSYLYSVSTVYADGTEMRASAPSLTVSPRIVAQPGGLKARQKGAYSIFAEWEAPGTNLVCKSWYNPATANLRGFGIGIDGQTIECGVGFLQAEMANYEGYSISKVNFYPMSEQWGWTLNIYKYEGATPVRIYSQPVTQELNYKHRNTVVLDEPVPVPTDGDLVVAFEVVVPFATMNVIGMDYGHYYPGYSDLVRLSSDPDLYSYYYASLENGYPDYASFMIEAVLTGEGEDLSADELTGYRLSLDGDEQLMTTDEDWKSDKVSQASHVLSVQAVYADGKVSDPVSTTVDVAYDYKKVEAVDVKIAGSQVDLQWQAPMDDDTTEITYAHGQPQAESIIGPMENNYGILAAVEYGQKLLSGYDGYEITGLRFYPIGNATYTFLLAADDEFIAEVPVYDYELYTWNTVQLDEPIYIDANATYMLVLDCYDGEPDCPSLAIDNRLPLSFTSDLVSTDGSYWSSILVETGLSGNWMMGMMIADPEAQPMAVDGYDVVIDGKTVGEKVEQTSFSCDLAEQANGKHNLRVNTYYTGRAVSVKGDLITFTIDIAGIRDLMAETYRLQRGTDVLAIEGGDVSQIAVIAADGNVMARAMGNKVGISSLPAGVYMVKAVAAGQNLCYKIVID